MSISTVEVSVRGVRSPVLTAGPPDDAEAVVFVHGNPGPSDDWRDLLPRAGELGRAIALDMPGYGRAGKPKDFSYSVDGYAVHLAALLDQLGITRAHIVAHDFGGAWALAWAARAGERIPAMATARSQGLIQPLAGCRARRGSRHRGLLRLARSGALPHAGWPLRGCPSARTRPTRFRLRRSPMGR